MKQDELSNAIEQIIALSMAILVDDRDKPIIAPMIRNRARKVTAEIVTLIERAGE